MASGEAEDSLNAADGHHILLAVHELTERSDMGAGLLATGQQLLRGSRRVCGPVLFRNPMATAFLAEMLAQQLTGAGIEHPHGAPIPLDPDLAADPARGRAVVRCLDFDAAVEVHSAFASGMAPAAVRAARASPRRT